MHVFVTGASGLIGKSVTNELLKAGHTILALARSEESAQQLIASGVEVQRGSITDIDALKAGAAASDGVIHLAFVHDFVNYAQSCRDNRDAIRAMGDVLAGSNRPLIITSGTMLLRRGHLGYENDVFDASSPFAARGECETLAISLADEGIRSSVVRLAPTNHGNNDNHAFIPMLISKARETGVSAYIGNGLNRWPAVHYLDSGAAYRLALEKASAGSTYHVLAEEGVRMKDIAEVIGKRLGVPVESMSIDKAETHFGSWFATVLATDNPCSNKKTREELGWEPQQCTLLADLEDGNYFDIVEVGK